MARKKINWLLILQGWAMLWVVIGHSPLSLKNMPEWVEFLFNLAYSFHMPLFILVSGYLFQMTRLKTAEMNGGEIFCNYKSIITDKLVRLGIPFLVFTAIAMIVKVLNPGEVSRQTAFSLAELTRAIANPFEGPNNEMWFIMTIFWFFVLAPMWQLACKKRYTEVILMIILFVLHFNHPSTNWLSIRYVCHHAVYFYSGILICKHGLETKGQNLRWGLLTLGILIYGSTDIWSDRL